MGARERREGRLASGSQYVVEVPERWNESLLLYSKPVPVPPGEPPWPVDEPLINHLVASGYAVAGAANAIFWPVERGFTDQPAVLDVASSILGGPRRTLAFGLSIGGLMSAGLVQVMPERLSGALPMCGNMAGAVANHNRELDIAFVVKTLIAPDSGLQIVDIADPQANLRLAHAILEEAQGTLAGRARLALAAAMGNIPGWHDPTTREPDRADYSARQLNHYAWFQEPGFLVYFWAREQVERQAGGNPSWNTGVDYRHLLDTSINADVVEALYAEASVDLDADLARLDSEPRIEAHPAAVAYLERHIVFNGGLGVPVLTVHSDGDGLVTPDHQAAYADVVAHAGNEDLLRQLYVHRGGHCTFTFSEILTALDVLIERIDGHSWPVLEPDGLNGAAQRLGPDLNTLPSGVPMAPGFFEFEPDAFRRMYDSRHLER